MSGIKTCKDVGKKIQFLSKWCVCTCWTGSAVVRWTFRPFSRKTMGGGLDTGLNAWLCCLQNRMNKSNISLQASIILQGLFLSSRPLTKDQSQDIGRRQVWVHKSREEKEAVTHLQKNNIRGSASQLSRQRSRTPPRRPVQKT